jgi:hypothetical protein
MLPRRVEIVAIRHGSRAESAGEHGGIHWFSEHPSYWYRELGLPWQFESPSHPEAIALNHSTHPFSVENPNELSWNPPISDWGKRQAVMTAEYLYKTLNKPIDYVICSPALRCQQTANTICRTINDIEKQNNQICLHGSVEEHNQHHKHQKHHKHHEKTEDLKPFFQSQLTFEVVDGLYEGWADTFTCTQRAMDLFGSPLPDGCPPFLTQQHCRYSKK